MAVLNKKITCKHGLSAKLQSGANLVSVNPVFSHDSLYVIIASGSDAKVFRIKSGECIRVLNYHSRPVVSIRENKKNILQIFTCSDDGVVARWDYMQGVILQVYNLQMTVAAFYVPTSDGPWFVSKKFDEDQYRLYSLKPKESGISDVTMILKSVEPNENSVAFGVMGRYCVSIGGNTLYIYKFESKRVIRHKTGKYNLTCVACHPSEFIFATGDDGGRILLWSNALDSNHPIRSIYHWHTLPVADLTFSSEGSHLLSGGGEAALIKWNLFSEEKWILPRMGAPIVYISASKDNSYVITAHSDNVLQVVDAQQNVVQVIQGLTKWCPQKTDVLPTGLLYNAHLKALLMNGKPGHLQFYDIQQDKQLFNLDIAGKNYISQERDNSVSNIDVHKAAVDDTGLWLATNEYWSNGDTSPQIWLKFWMFDLQKQIFVLNTNIILPHHKELNCIVFKPNAGELNPLPLAATTSNDGRFKIWTLGDTESDGKQCWNCESVGYYRDLPAGSACFSEDGSLLAVAFKNIATLWTVEQMHHKAVLCDVKNKRNIKQLLFGRHSCCQYLVCQDGASITVWDVLSLSVLWTAYTEVQVLTNDITSSDMAAICKEQCLTIFKPDSPYPVRTIERVSDTSVIAALFVPLTNTIDEESGCFHEHSQLFFVDESQNLFAVSEREPEEEITCSKKKKSLIETPFRMLQAVDKVSGIKQVEAEQFNLTKEEKDENIISNPALQNPVALCSLIISSLLQPANKNKDISDSEKQHDVTKKEKDEDENNLSAVNNEFIINNVDMKKLKLINFSFLRKMVVFSESEM